MIALSRAARLCTGTARCIAFYAEGVRWDGTAWVCPAVRDTGYGPVTSSDNGGMFPYVGSWWHVSRRAARRHRRPHAMLMCS
jgi:hypothetical protein